MINVGFVEFDRGVKGYVFGGSTALNIHWKNHWPEFEARGIHFEDWDKDKEYDVLFVGNSISGESFAEVNKWLDEHPKTKTLFVNCHRNWKHANVPEVQDFLSRVNCIVTHTGVDTNKNGYNVLQSSKNFQLYVIGNFNLFDEKPYSILPLSERSDIISSFGRLMPVKGIDKYLKNADKFLNNEYKYCTIGSSGITMSKKETDIRDFYDSSFSMKSWGFNLTSMSIFENKKLPDNCLWFPKLKTNLLSKEKFNIIDTYDRDDPEFIDFRAHIRFAVFGYGYNDKNAKIQSEANEYALLETIQSGTPVITFKRYVDAIRVYEEKPDVENSGFFVIDDWGDLNAENIKKFEQTYEESTKKQYEFMMKWWGNDRIIDHFCKYFNELVETKTWSNPLNKSSFDSFIS